MIVAIRKTAFRSLSPARQQAFKHIAERVIVGEPSVWLSPTGAAWYVLSDTRWTLRDAAYLAAAAAHATSIPPNWSPPASRSELRSQARQFIQDRVVWPVEVGEGEDAHQAVVAAQGAPASFLVLDHIPDGWKPQEDTNA